MYLEVKTAVHLGTADNLAAKNVLKIFKNKLKLVSEN
jgi:hypothetical protein